MERESVASGALEAAFKYSSIGMAIVSTKGKFLKVNNSLCKSLGYTHNELTELDIMSITHKEDLEKSGENFKKMVLKEISNYQTEKRYYHKNGKIIWCLLNASTVFDDEENVAYLISQIQDITERKEIENKLVQAYQMYQLVIDASQNGIWDWPDITRDEQYWSPKWKELLGFKEDDKVVATASKFYSLLHPDDAEKTKIALNNTFEDTKKLFELKYRLKTQNEGYKWFSVKAIMSKNLETNNMRMTGSLTDIDEKMKSQEKLDQYMQRLEKSNQDLNDFAYIASHDLKEPLRGLANNAAFLKEDYKDIMDESALKRIDRMIFLCDRMERLINDLLHFAKLKNQDMSYEEVSLDEVIEDIQKTLANTIKDDNVKIIINEEMPKIQCIKIAITELYKNLILNAIKYNDKESKKVEIGFDDKNAENRIYYVKDNGIGIEEKHYDDIFRIFKRLNDENDKVKGTGVGLSFVKKVVERHNGKIWLDSKIGKGTNFYFTLD